MNLFPSFIVDKRRFYSRNSTHLFLLLPGNNSNSISSGIKGKRNKGVSSNNLQLVLVGLCLGVTLGVAFVPLFEIECNVSLNSSTDENHVFNGNHKDAPLAFNSGHETSGGRSSKVDSEIKANYLAASRQRNAFMRRPRFFSTELGLRKKLIAGIILTDISRIENVLALNRTLGPHVNQLLFFAVGQNWAKKLKSAGLSGVVTLTESKDSFRNRSSSSFLRLDKPQYNRAALKVMRYFGNKFADGFDYFFVGIDVFYINGKNLMKSVKNISISQNVIWGSSAARIEQDICRLESGMVLSRSVIKTVSSRIDRCLSSPSLNIGATTMTKCFQYAFGTNSMKCSDSVQDNLYLVASSENLEDINEALSVGPVSSAKEIYNIHISISEMRLNKVGQETEEVAGIIDRMAPLIPSGFDVKSWPIGLPPPHIPSSRFDVLKWKFFNLDTIYPENEHTSEGKVDGVHELDLASVVNFSTRYLQSHYFPASQKNSLNLNKMEESNLVSNGSTASPVYRFEYGYRRLDETRGMEYILNFIDAQGHVKRVECLRPLSKIEIVPMPFVTENRRLSIVVPVTLDEIDDTERFLASFFDLSSDKKVNCVLILAIVVNDSITDSSTVSRLHKLKQLISEHNYNQNKNSVNPTNSTVVVSSTEILKVAYIIVNMRQVKTKNFAVAICDTLSTRILQNPSNLVLLGGKLVHFKDEFLNRVRMNTILNHQVFSPIPFVQFDPRLSRLKAKREDEVEIHKETGYWDKDSYDFISFCIGDYSAARRRLNSTGIRLLLNSEGASTVAAISDILVHASQAHFLRVPEPSLQIRFDRSIYNNCSETKLCFKQQWGSKADLAKLILKYTDWSKENDSNQMNR